jgi:hypothetical protein
MAEVGRHRREWTSLELDLLRRAAPIVQPRHLDERRKPRTTRFLIYTATPIRGMRSLETRTELSLRLPHFPYPETMCLPVAPN